MSGLRRVVADAEITRFGATSGWPVTRPERIAAR